MEPRDSISEWFDRHKYVRRILIGVLSFPFVVIGLVFLAIILHPSERETAESKTDCLIFYTASQHGDINLPVGTIYGYPARSGENLYDIIRDDTFIMSAYFIESFSEDFRCFDTEEDAVAAGYKKYLSDQAGRKKARLEAQERLDAPIDKNATSSGQLLRDIDSVLGF